MSDRMMNSDELDSDSAEYPCPPGADVNATPMRGKSTLPTNHGPTGKAAHPRAIGHKTSRAAEHSAPAHKPPPKKGY